MGSVLQDEATSDRIVAVLQIQKAAEVGHAMTQGQATEVFLPADISNLFGMVQQKLGT